MSIKKERFASFVAPDKGCAIAARAQDEWRKVGYIGEKDRPSRHPADATLPFKEGKNELPYGMN